MNANRFSIVARFLACIAIVLTLAECAPARLTSSLGPAQDGPFNLYVTLPEDTAHGLIVNYHTLAAVGPGKVHFDTEPRGGDITAYRYTATQTGQRRIPGLPDGRVIHSVHMDNLEPGTEYYFIAGDANGGYTSERILRTLPAGPAPLRFVTGGDMDVTRRARNLLVQAARYEPAFVLIGGDIAYADGELMNARIWDAWFHQWDRYLNQNAGYIVPMMLAIGNHEVNNLDSTDPAIRAPFYTGFFGNQSEATYFTRRFGDHTAIVVLDSGHITPHAAQVDWLRVQLEAMQDVPFRFACYHVPLYPAQRDFEGAFSQLGRTHWLPLFDAYALTAAFENHDHVFKRTHPLRDNEIHAEGTVYLGDGSFGRSPRRLGGAPRWYIDRATNDPHFWVVEVKAYGVTFRAVDQQGREFDTAVLNAAAGELAGVSE